jgi:hypothetical protein
MRRPHALRVPTSPALSSVISSLHVPDEACPTRSASDPSGRYVPCLGGHVDPISPDAPADRLKPVLDVVHRVPRLSHMSVNNSTRVPCGLTRNTSRSAGEVCAILIPVTSTLLMVGPPTTVSVELMVPASTIDLGTSVLE